MSAPQGKDQKGELCSPAQNDERRVRTCGLGENWPLGTGEGARGSQMEPDGAVRDVKTVEVLIDSRYS